MPGILNQMFESFILIIRWILSPINHLFNQERIDYPSEGSADRASSTPDASSSERAGAVRSVDEDFAREGLRHHNEFRRKHGVPDLKLSPELNKFSKQWAKVLAQKETLDHRPDNKYGENLFFIFSPNITWQAIAEQACRTWYDEIKLHKFGAESMGQSGHFTQMIWKASEELGFSMEKSKSGKIYVVANYNPAGNMRGRYTANVPPQK